MTQSISDFCEFDKLAASSRSNTDIELWKQWNSGGRTQDDTEKLLSNFSGLIHQSVNKFAADKNVPKAAVHAEFQTQAMKAFESYDPNRGAQLSTHVQNQLRRGDRFVRTYQNVGRIVENRIYRITEFKRERTNLEDKLGRPSSASELADHLKWPVNQVVAMENELRGQLPTSRSTIEHRVIMPSVDAEILRLIPYELSAEEKIVFEYSMGVNGKPMLNPGKIASTTGMSASKVSKLRTSIANKIEKFR